MREDTDQTDLVIDTTDHIVSRVGTDRVHDYDLV